MARKLIYAREDREALSDARREVDIAERRAEDLRQRAEVGASPLRVGDAVPPERLAEAEAAVDAARTAFDALVDEVTDRSEEWVLEPIGHEEYRELLKKHPPRTTTEGEGEKAKEVTHPDDEGWGFNTETFGKALLLFVDPEDDEIRTVVEPVFESATALRKRMKRLSSGEFESLWSLAYLENDSVSPDPKALRFSPAGPRSDAT